jgi:tetratricopeptide (TPR) repeat protein
MSSVLRKIRGYFDFDHIAFYLILGTIFFLPIFFVFGFRDIFYLPKETFLTVVVIVLSILSLFEVLRRRQISIRRTAFDIPLLVFFCFVALSSIFSLSPHLSFWGKMDSFVLHLFGLSLCVLWSWFLIQKLGKESFFRSVFITLLCSGIVTSFLFLSEDIPYVKDFFSFSLNNTISATHSIFGLWTLTLFLLSVGTLLPKGFHQKFLTFISALSLLVLLPVFVRLNLQFIFVLFCLGTGLVFLLGMTFFGQVRKYILALVFLLFLFSLFKILFPDILSWSRSFPSEVSLSHSLSLEVTKDTLFSNTKTFLIGSGPGTFVYDFSLFRPSTLNSTPYFWTFRFDQPYNTVFVLFSELGILGTISFLVIILLSLGTIISTFVHLRSDTVNKHSFLSTEKFSSVRFEYFSFMIAWFVLSMGMFVVVYNFSLWFLWWTLLAFVLLGLSCVQPSLIRKYQKYFTIGPQYFLLIAFFSLLLSGGIFVLGSFWAKNVISEYIFSQIGKRPTESVSLLNKTLSYQGGNSEYLLRLSKEYFDRSQILLKTDPKSAAQILSQSIDFSRQAKEKDPNNVRVWEMLSVSYIQTFPFLDPKNAKASLTWATEAIDEAIRLEGTNPLFHGEKAFILQYGQQYDDAEKEYLKAIELKPDYLQATFDLAKMYEIQGNPQKAIDLYEKTLQNLPENTDLLYEFGRLLFNQKNFESDQKAEQVWKKALSLQPNSLNTLYSLGLLSEKYGKIAQARLFYQKVKELAPENTDIDKKLKNL